MAGACALSVPSEQRILQNSIFAGIATRRRRRQQVRPPFLFGALCIIIIILAQLKSFSNCRKINTQQDITTSPAHFHHQIQHIKRNINRQQSQLQPTQQQQWPNARIILQQQKQQTQQNQYRMQDEPRIRGPQSGGRQSVGLDTSRNMRSLGDWFRAIDNVALAKRNHLKDAQANKKKHFIYHHHQHQRQQNHHQNTDFHSNLKALPNGPPPFRPSGLILSLNSFGALEKLKRTKLFKRMYKSKVYYLFIDVLQQLAELATLIAKKKIEITGSNVAAIQAVTSKLILKGSQLFKLKWPLVMLNPHFIKEILANPTFLVMLFHTIEVAYMSMPVSFWLKPIVKLVRQPSPEKEEQVWWRRKRIYDVLNGHGSSELEPNLKAKHFRHTGEPAPISLSELTHSIRQITGRPGPSPAYTNTLANSLPYPTRFQSHHREPELELAQQPFALSPAIDEFESQQHEHHTYQDHEQPVTDPNTNAYITSAQEESFLANQKQHQDYHKITNTIQKHAGLHQAHESAEHKYQAMRPLFTDESKITAAEPSMANQLFDPSSEGHELMSQDEFNMLDPKEREIVLRTAHYSLAEGQLADEIIKQQSDYVKSIAQSHGEAIAMPDFRHSHETIAPFRST